MKKRMNRIMASRRNSCFEKMDNHPIHTIPNPDLTKMVVLPKTFLQIILAAKWLVHAAFNYVPLVGGELCRPFCIFPSTYGGIPTHKHWKHNTVERDRIVLVSTGDFVSHVRFKSVL